jgi:hypothetical protein
VSLVTPTYTVLLCTCRKDADKLEKVKAMREASKRVTLGPDTLPSICFYTLLNSAGVWVLLHLQVLQLLVVHVHAEAHPWWQGIFLWLSHWSAILKVLLSDCIMYICSMNFWFVILGHKYIGSVLCSIIYQTIPLFNEQYSHHSGCHYRQVLPCCADLVVSDKSDVLFLTEWRVQKCQRTPVCWQWGS